MGKLVFEITMQSGVRHEVWLTTAEDPEKAADKCAKVFVSAAPCIQVGAAIFSKSRIESIVVRQA